MPKLIALILLLFLCPAPTDVDKLIRNGNFTETRQKMNVPLKVWNRAGVMHFEEVANPGEDWNCCCTRTEGLPNFRMNWAAHDASGNWIISMSSGGWSLITNVKVVTTDADQPVATYASSPEDSTLSLFRRNYMKGLTH